MLDKLSNKVVYDFKSKKYVAVFFSRFVRLWTSTTSDVNRVKKLKLPKLVHELLSFQRQDTIVLYKDGSCESLARCLEMRKQSTAVVGRPVIAGNDVQQSISGATTFAAGCAVAAPMMTYFVHNHSDGSVDLVYYKLDADTLAASGPIRRMRLARPGCGAKLIGQVVVDGEMQPSLMTLCEYEYRGLFHTVDRMNL